MRNSVSNATRQATLQMTVQRRTSPSVPFAIRLAIHNNDVLGFGNSLRMKLIKVGTLDKSTTYSRGALNVDKTDTSNVQKKVGAKTPT